MDSCHHPNSLHGTKVAVSLTARVGADGFPSCSRTGSGPNVAAAFDAAETMITRGLKVQTAPDGQEIYVSVKGGGPDTVTASATTLSEAIASARRSLLEKKQGE